MMNYLWSNRDCPPLGGGDWLKSWVKRFQQLPNLLKQGLFHWQLRRGGAKIEGSAFFSDAGMISGRLDQLVVGEHSFVGRADISVHASLSIGACVCINDGARLLTASHDVTSSQWATVAKPIIIEDHVWIATNAIVLPGVRLGRGAVVGAGAVVSKDVPPLGIVAGNPAVLLNKRRVDRLEYRPTSLLALFGAWRSIDSPAFSPYQSELK